MRGSHEAGPLEQGPGTSDPDPWSGMSPSQDCVSRNHVSGLGLPQVLLVAQPRRQLCLSTAELRAALMGPARRKCSPVPLGSANLQRLPPAEAAPGRCLAKQIAPWP